jgi:hypothetical protein
MSEYQAYWVRRDGPFAGFVRLHCRDDAEAVEQSRRLVDHRPVELWCGERFIARLEPPAGPDTCKGYESRMTRQVWPHVRAKSKHSVDGRARGRRGDRVQFQRRRRRLDHADVGAGNVLTTVDGGGPYRRVGPASCTETKQRPAWAHLQLGGGLKVRSGLILWFQDRLVVDADPSATRCPVYGPSCGSQKLLCQVRKRYGPTGIFGLLLSFVTSSSVQRRRCNRVMSIAPP